jgi:hypothetical protein
MRGISLVALVALLFSAQGAIGAPLRGQVSESVSSESSAENPPADSLFPNVEEAQSDTFNQSARSNNLRDSVVRFGAHRGVVVITPRMPEGVDMNEALLGQLDSRRSYLNGNAEQQLSCIGICYEAFSGRVIRVLPGSDLYGSVFPGDRLISEDGLGALESWQHGKNFGPAGSLTNITFEGREGVKTIACHRKPVGELMPGYESALNWSALGR